MDWFRWRCGGTVSMMFDGKTTTGWQDTPSPVMPWGQAPHARLDGPRGKHWTPGWQGDESQVTAETSLDDDALCSQCWPLKPKSHAHRYPRSDVAEGTQVPWLWHPPQGSSSFELPEPRGNSHSGPEMVKNHYFLEHKLMMRDILQTCERQKLIMARLINPQSSTDLHIWGNKVFLL